MRSLEKFLSLYRGKSMTKEYKNISPVKKFFHNLVLVYHNNISKKKLKENLNKYIDIIFMSVDCSNILTTRKDFRYLTGLEILKSCKKYLKNDPTPSVWTTFYDCISDSIFEELNTHAKETLLSDMTPLDAIKIESVSSNYFWNDVWYFDRHKIAFYNLSRIKSYTFSQDSFGVTTLLLSNEENIEGSKVLGSRNYIEIKNIKNMINICNALEKFQSPLGVEIRCLIECMDIQNEYDIFYRSTWE